MRFNVPALSGKRGTIIIPWRIIVVTTRRCSPYCRANRVVNISWPLHILELTVLLLSPLSRKRMDIKSHSSVCPFVRPSVCLSVCHKNINLGHNFCAIKDRALILGMCVPCDKTFPVVPCRDLDDDLWSTLRSNLLPSGGPQFSEFAYLTTH